MIETRAEAERQIIRDIETCDDQAIWSPADYDIAGIANACHAITGNWHFDRIDERRYWQIVGRHHIPSAETSSATRRVGR